MSVLLEGTGYLTACFGVMVGSEGCVVGIEHIPELVSWSIENIKKSAAAPLLEASSLSIHVGGNTPPLLISVLISEVKLS